MKIEIKKALLEGHTPEVIVEAVHSGTAYEKGTALGKLNRPKLAKSIKDALIHRDNMRGYSNLPESFKPDRAFGNTSANFHDNVARLKSQTSKENLHHKELPNGASEQQPRLYQAAKQ